MQEFLHKECSGGINCLERGPATGSAQKATNYTPHPNRERERPDQGLPMKSLPAQPGRYRWGSDIAFASTFFTFCAKPRRIPRS